MNIFFSRITFVLLVFPCDKTLHEVLKNPFASFKGIRIFSGRVREHFFLIHPFFLIPNPEPDPFFWRENLLFKKKFSNTNRKFKRTICFKDHLFLLLTNIHLAVS